MSTTIDTPAPPKTQRWASVPSVELPLRDNPIFAGKIPMRPVLRFAGRQHAYAGVAEWIDARAIGYSAKWPRASQEAARAEASIDLISWQRRKPDALLTAEFINNHEEAHPE